MRDTNLESTRSSGLSGQRKFYVNGYTSRNIWLCCKKYLETKKAVQEVR